ncbi:hypothetical protein GGR50DRAFT_692941 [Xylaria sp. CBS 124048]|nr:hypothetical protein GGR50DRAFT_692941 [Xylaria sp. CBS 124048]
MRNVGHYTGAPGDDSTAKQPTITEAKKLSRKRKNLDRKLIDLIIKGRKNRDLDESTKLRKLSLKYEAQSKKERLFVEKCYSQLADLRDLYIKAPSFDRATDYDVSRKANWRMQRRFGAPLWKTYAPHNEHGDQANLHFFRNHNPSFFSSKDRRFPRGEMNNDDMGPSAPSGPDNGPTPNENEAKPSNSLGEQGNPKNGKRSVAITGFDVGLSPPGQGGESQATGPRHKRAKSAADNATPSRTPSKKVRFALDHEYHGESSTSSKKNGKGGQAPDQESHTNGK